MLILVFQLLNSEMFKLFVELEVDSHHYFFFRAIEHYIGVVVMVSISAGDGLLYLDCFRLYNWFPCCDSEQISCFLIDACITLDDLALSDHDGEHKQN